MAENHDSQAMDTSHQGEGGGGFQREADPGRPVRPRWIIILILGALGVVFLLLLVFVFVQGPAVKCETDEAGFELWQRGGAENTAYYVGDQVIITGPGRRVDPVIDRVEGDRGIKLEPIRECKLNHLGASWRLKDAVRSYPSRLLWSRQATPALVEAPRLQDLARAFLDGRPSMGLYRVPGTQRVENIVEQINEAGRAHGVSAELNYLTGLLDLSACGRPHSDGGSPFNGPPKLLPVGEEEAVKEFWEQWAFQHIQAGHALKEAVDGATILHQGNGVVVGVFDTSPFVDPWGQNANRGRGTGAIETEETVKWVTPTMDVERLVLKVTYPEPQQLNALEAVDVPDDGTEPGDVRDHGLFVAGLVHAVAPASEVRLIKVLNEDGCGDLFTLREALERFTGEVKRERGDLRDVVINLSLGIHTESDEDAPDSFSSTNDTGADNEIDSLRDTLSNAKDAGAVIVAAAGNDSGRTDPDDENAEPTTMGPQIPAKYGFVVGVEASNIDRERACFSNTAEDVAAPGGDGGCARNAAGECDDNCVGDRCKCAAQHQVCEVNATEEGGCAEAVIGPVLFPPDNDGYWPTHYGYWSGTSFGAPLVSGLVALLLEAQATADTGEAPSPDANQVETTISCIKDGIKDGVINIPATLDVCPR